MSVFNEIWKTTIVSSADLLNPSSQFQQINVFSEIVCAIAATQTSWATLFCFLNGVCNMSSYMAVPYPSLLPISDPLNCMTRLDGCVQNNKLFNFGDYNCYGPFVYQCVNGQMIPLPNPPSKSTCPSPFRYDSYGCTLYSQGNSLSWCEARKDCMLTYGSDLIAFENASTTADFQSYISSWSVGNQYITGMYGSKLSFQWVTGKQINNVNNLWYSASYPVGTYDPSCGLIYSVSGVYGLIDTPCSDTEYIYFCEIKIV